MADEYDVELSPGGWVERENARSFPPSLTAQVCECSRAYLAGGTPALSKLSRNRWLWSCGQVLSEVPCNRVIGGSWLTQLVCPPSSSIASSTCSLGKSSSSSAGELGGRGGGVWEMRSVEQERR